MTPAQQLALRDLDENGGEGVIDKSGRLVAGGVRMTYLADTWLRLLTTGHVEAVGPLRLRITTRGCDDADAYRAARSKTRRPETIHAPMPAPSAAIPGAE